MGLKINLKKGLKGINKFVNKVGSTASSVVSKVSGLPGVNLIPGMSQISNVANTVGGLIQSGKSAPRGNNAPVMASPKLEFAPSSASAFSGSVSSGNTRVSIQSGKETKETTIESGAKSWFAKNKIVVFFGGGIALLGVVMVFLRGKGGRYRGRR